ncbi:glycosyltransferase involved in cell wall biosynthesis [Larkinella arboricola]|uniref:Glycosyltransferase involved in cell wall biosynthesis n=1 Tax=Larkinella arboricola TaxID=643671 RepID=A0A327X7X3_LARAB|nr:glycosyltransferase [Larkinella arboricola]RAK01983.1 glycosyltransferase involved in cell wall biosynthesis [Larkinella arboricola]
MNREQKILLFDTIIDGHHADYLTHLIRYWVDNQRVGELIVVTQQAFQPYFQDLTDQQAGATNVRFVPIPASDVETVHRASMLTRSFKEWNLLLKYIHAYQPTHALLMYFDLFQLATWLGRSAPCPISGIYFRPDFHYKQNPGFKAQLNGLRKKVTLKGALRQRSLANVFCLDHSAVEGLRQLSPAANIWPLADPVESYSITPTEIGNLRTELRIEPDRQIFLLFGYLDERKGIEPLLDALKELPVTEQKAICLVLAGPVQPDFQEKIEQKIGAVGGPVQIVRVFREIKGREIQLFFELADYALALYQKHVGMASVVVRAAVSRKPVLASDYGYLGHLVQSEQLGAVADTTSPSAIRALLQRVLTEKIPYSAENLQKLADRNSDVYFAETIFNHL